MAFSLAVDWNMVLATGKTFGLFVIGMVVYAIFIFSFYQKVSKKYLFELDLKPYEGAHYAGWKRFGARLAYALKYVFLVPVLLFIWFVVLAALLLLLNKDMVVESGLLIGMSLLATIRIGAYYNEDLSVDLAKIMPLALLGIFLLDTRAVDLAIFWAKVLRVPSLIGLFATYFAFTVVLEFLLRIYDAIANRE